MLVSALAEAVWIHRLVIQWGILMTTRQTGSSLHDAWMRWKTVLQVAGLGGNVWAVWGWVADNWTVLGQSIGSREYAAVIAMSTALFVIGSWHLVERECKRRQTKKAALKARQVERFQGLLPEVEDIVAAIGQTSESIDWLPVAEQVRVVADELKALGFVIPEFQCDQARRSWLRLMDLHMRTGRIDEARRMSRGFADQESPEYGNELRRFFRNKSQDESDRR